jgi:hypothetical protein
MPGSNGAGSPSSDLELESPGHSRRSLLKGAATVGAAGIATAALAGAALPAAASNRSAALDRTAGTAPAEGSEQFVVHVRDTATGEMDVFRGTTCTHVRDTQLAARLFQAAR